MSRKRGFKSVVRDSDWEAVSPENRQLMDDFLEYKKTGDRSETTINQYRYMLRIFFAWNVIGTNNTFFTDIKKREFVRFFTYLKNTLNASSNRVYSLKSVLSSLSNFIEDILDDEYSNYKNVVKNIEIATREPILEKTVLNRKSVTRCLNRLVDDGHFQIACFMALGVCCGARLSELLRFKADYFKPEYIVFDCMYKTPEKIITKGKGREGKLLYKYTFVEPFTKYYKLWMAERQIKGIDCEYLFVCRDKYATEWHQASQSTTARWAKVISDYMNCEFYFHSLRHLWCTELKRKGLPDSVIQQLQGWSDASMINIYSDLDMDDMISKYFDKNGVRKDLKKNV